MYHEFVVSCDGEIDHFAIQRWIKQKMDELQSVTPGIVLKVRWRGSAVDKAEWNDIGSSSSEVKTDNQEK